MAVLINLEKIAFSSTFNKTITLKFAVMDPRGEEAMQARRSVEDSLKLNLKRRMQQFVPLLLLPEGKKHLQLKIVYS